MARVIAPTREVPLAKRGCLGQSEHATEIIRPKRTLALWKVVGSPTRIDKTVFDWLNARRANEADPDDMIAVYRR